MAAGGAEAAQQRVRRLLGASFCVLQPAQEQRGVLARQPHPHAAHLHCLHSSTTHSSGTSPASLLLFDWAEVLL